MQYHIAHTTTYHYSRPVRLSSHTLRLRPRCDGTQWVAQFSLEMQPQPFKIAEILDLPGNAALQVWFSETPTDLLKISTVFTVETRRTNPFDYFSEPWALTAPIDYPSAVAAQLRPYLQPVPGISLGGAVVDFAQTLLHEVEGNVGLFLSQLNQSLYQRCQYRYRPQGDPQPASVTWATQAGSCRDLTVLFMELCRAVGLAARFVSGYQEGDLDQAHRELHAWPEVYIPGGGWRGFDPTHGLAVADQHIALAAAPQPRAAAPVVGRLCPGERADTTLDYQIRIRRLD